MVSLEKTEFFYVITFSSKEREDCYKKEKGRRRKNREGLVAVANEEKKVSLQQPPLPRSLSLGLSLPKQGKKPSDPF